MAFIDIFNYKKYFKKTSDAQVARIGHVNALYDKLSASSYTPPYKSYSVQMGWNSPGNGGDGIPVINELYNDTTFTITWNPSTDANFYISGFQGLTNNNIFVIANFVADDGATPLIYTVSPVSDVGIQFSVFYANAIGGVSIIGNGSNLKAHIEIRIYN